MTLALESSYRGLRSVLSPLSKALRTVLIERCQTVLAALGADADADDLFELARALQDAVDSSDEKLWLARSVIGASLPTDIEAQGVVTTFRLDGLWPALEPTVQNLRKTTGAHPTVRVVRGKVTIDVGETAGSTYLSGIQRVVRETCRRWAGRPEALFIGWSVDERSLRALTPAEQASLLADGPGEGSGEDATESAGEGAGEGAGDVAAAEVLVPWEGTHLVPELVAVREKTPRLLTLNRYARCEVGYIGFDCVPIMVSNTVHPGMITLFARNLAAARYADRIATISHATAVEYQGWRGMCHGRGPLGPRIQAVPLPVEARTPDDDAVEAARRLLQLHDHPVVLVVGSHEPRKNHLAVVHAAELLWREGLRFTLAMVGAGSWRADAYEQVVAERIAAGRPLLSIRGLPDELLWAAYQVAHFTVFPSLHEGFGLPVAESLAAGTPAITSNFGSMREIVAPQGEPLGGLLVDPRDDHELAAAMRTLLTEPETRERLIAQTRQRPQRSWDDYARELWEYLVENRAPDQ